MTDEEPSIKETMAEAAAAEAAKDNVKAIELYSKAIKADELNAYAYDRLMKIYRQLKDYKKELATINKGIRTYEQFYRSGSKTRSKKVNEISNKLNRSFGLTDKKGNSLYDPEPIARWKKRKITVEKKLK
jgi:tetratricopeptide (TPR) repeat protein